MKDASSAFAIEVPLAHLLRSLWLVASSMGGEDVAVAEGFQGKDCFDKGKGGVLSNHCTSLELLKRQFILKNNTIFFVLLIFH